MNVEDYIDRLSCPGGCNTEIAIKIKNDVVYAVHSVFGPGQSEEIDVKIPVFVCSECDEAWTGIAAEEIRTAAVTAARIREEIDQQILKTIYQEHGQEIKINKSL